MDAIVVTGKQAERALREAAERVLREVAPRFRLDERDRPGKNWLTNPEAQAYLGLSKATLARYRATGKLPYSKVGSSVYYHVAAIERMIEGGKHEPSKVRDLSESNC